ncbi:LacI family DNA-binding transcriptional regulator [Salinispira pacifica]
MGATIRDVARLAGVSTATVSRVINDDPRISGETRQRVLTSVARLNYKVNTIARSLKINRTYTVGFITPEIANDFFMTVAQGVENELRSRGYDMIICNSNEDPAQERERIDLLLEKCVDGLIIIPSSSEGAHFSALSRLNLPVVLVDRLVNGFEADAVLVDNAGGCYHAIQHLWMEGYRRFGFIGGNLELTSARERYDGFLAALAEHGVEPDREHMLFGDFHEGSGYELFGRLAAHPDPPEVVFVSNYYMHIGAAHYLVTHREELGRHPLIASFDDMTLSSIAGYAIVSVSQPIREIGARAADLLVSRMGEADLPFPRLVRLPTRLIVHGTGRAGATARGSAGAPPGGG